LFVSALDGILLLNAETAQIQDVNPSADIAQSKEMVETIQVDGRVGYENLPLKAKSGPRIDVEFVSDPYECEGVRSRA